MASFADLVGLAGFTGFLVVAMMFDETVRVEMSTGEPGTRTASAKEKNLAERKHRFSAVRLAAHRSKLGLSAADYGRLVGMSGATIYLWEQGERRPRPEQVQQLGLLKAMSRSAILKQLEQIKTGEAAASA